MAGDYTRYTVEDKDGNALDMLWEQDEYREAEKYAQKYKLRLISNEYEWEDSELVEDFTEKDQEED